MHIAILSITDTQTDAYKLWCWRRLLSPLDFKEIKVVNPKGNQPWIFIGRIDAEAEYFGPQLWRAYSLEKIPWYWEGLKAEGEGAAEDETIQ